MTHRDEKYDELRRDLEETEARCNALFEAASDLVFEIDSGGRYRDANPAHHDVLGIPPAELLGTSFYERVHGADLPVLQEALARPALEFPRFRVRTRDGLWTRLQLRAELPESRLGIGRTLVAREITEGHEAELARQERDKVRRMVAENIPGLVYLLSTGSQPEILYLSEAAEELLGLPVSELRERRRHLLDLIHPEDRGPYLEQLAESLRQKQRMLLTFRVLHRDGGWRWVEQRGQGVCDEEGQLRFLGGALFDVTERVERAQAKRQLEAQLFHAQKLESLGVLAGGIAHDFNNMMGVVKVTSELALQELPPHHPARALIDESLKATHRASTLTRELLTYTGRGLAEIRRLDLSEHVRETSELLLRSIPKKIELDLQLAESLPPVEVDVAQMQQVIMNLVINASEAIGSASGRIRLRCGLTRIWPEASRRVPTEGGAKADCYVFLRVEDDGAGMTKETQERIFDPFFTTKESGHGLGLAAVLGIVRAHGGEIELESQPGAGTAFTIYLPVSRGEAPTPEPTAVPRLEGEGRILVVDDETLIRNAACRVLSRYGYETLAAKNGSDAVTVFNQHASRIDLVLLDLSMPGLDGDEVFPLIRGLRPEIPVVFSSGYTESDALTRLRHQPHTSFLQKPYGPEELARIVKVTLQE